jgi:hypothetical protein
MCEQGMHSFQTLLEAHTDLAFDFFEAWSHRNIFVINANLPVVAPHHKDLDLETPPEMERELQIEVESSRRKLEHARVTLLFVRSWRNTRLTKPLHSDAEILHQVEKNGSSSCHTTEASRGASPKPTLPRDHNGRIGTEYGQFAFKVQFHKIY